jgi:DnaJ-class molecular chaperone
MVIRKRCPYCKGQGAIAGHDKTTVEPCPVCNQRGYNLVPSSAVTCTLCQGTGRIFSGGTGKICPDCGGIGSRW